MSRYILWVLLTASALFAQTFTGSISGRTTDPTGLAAPGVQIAVTDTKTNSVFRTVTGETGDYTVSFLNPGTYRVSFSAAGFKATVQTGILLNTGQQVRMDVTMEMGSVAETVQVSAMATQLDFVTPEVGHVMAEEELMNVPVVGLTNRGRMPVLFAKLMPGVTSTSSNNSNINNFSLGGGRPVTNEIYVDGLPTTNPSDQTSTMKPGPEALQEMKVVTTPFSAEYGHTGGGVLVMTSKSGTNTYHGDVYDYFRNRVLNDRNPFATTNNTKYVQNDPGVSVGGPVLIPKIYQGKDKTFFFVDFNVTLDSQGAVYSQLVPTDLEKAGDFSQTTSGGKVVPIYDPATTRLPSGSKTYLRDQFPGNIIPANRIDSVAAQIVKFYPAPNWNSGTLNYNVTPPKVQQVWQTLERVDHYFSANDRMFVRFGRYNPNSDPSLNIPGKANNTTTSGFRDTQIMVSETHVLGPRAVHVFHMGVIQEVNYAVASGGPAPELNLKGVNLSSFPIINVSASPMIPLGSGNSNRDRNRSYAIVDALSVQKGRHNLRMGGDYRRQMYNNYNPGKQPGTYTFSNSFSALPGSATTGTGFADLLLGLPTTTAFSGADYTYRMNINSSGAYIQDDFKVNSRLTLNLGLRWEYDGPYSEANGQFANFNPTLVNRTTGNLGEVVFAKLNGAPSHFSPNIYHNVLPRVGFAWNVLPKTILRGGYGVFRLPNIGYWNFGPISQYAVSATFSSLDNNITPVYQLSSGVPARPYNLDANGLPNVPASVTKPTSTVTELETRGRTPYTQVVSLGIQRQITNQWFMEIDYVGNKGTKLPVVLNVNQLPPSLWGSGNLQALRPFPQYSVGRYLANEGNSIYHSLQAKLAHQWKSGFMVSLAYTFSKLIDDVDPNARCAATAGVQNVYNLKAERGIGCYDVPHRFVEYFVYSVPLGRGGKWLNSTPVVKDLVSGWQISGVTEFQTGQVMTISQTNNTNGFTNVQRSNQVAPASLPRDQRTIGRWFNTSAFVAAPAYTLGNAPRFPLHGPGLNNWDMALMRNFPIHEQWKLQIRGEFYNAMNHPQWSNPNTTIGNNSYGVITSTNMDARTTSLALRIFF